MLLVLVDVNNILCIKAVIIQSQNPTSIYGFPKWKSKQIDFSFRTPIFSISLLGMKRYGCYNDNYYSTYRKQKKRSLRQEISIHVQAFCTTDDIDILKLRKKFWISYFFLIAAKLLNKVLTGFFHCDW